MENSKEYWRIKIFMININTVYETSKYLTGRLRQNTLLVSVSTSHAAGLRGHSKDHHKNGTNCLPGWQSGIMIIMVEV